VERHDKRTRVWREGKIQDTRLKKEKEKKGESYKEK